MNCPASTLSEKEMPFTRKWNLKILLLCHVLVVLLIGTLFSPYTKGFWSVIDIHFFKLINATLEGNRAWQVFWAMANHKLADWVEDFVFILFFVAYIRSAAKGFRLRKAADLLFIVIYSGLIIYFINRMLFRETLCIPRESPTIIVDSSIRLSEHISWMKIKDDSTKSFPGDHGTTALLFGACFAYIGSRKLKILAVLYAAFLCMPRLITGAHWFSDVVVGSGSIVLLFLSWAYCTPLAPWGISKIEAFMRRCTRAKNRLQKI